MKSTMAEGQSIAFYRIMEQLWLCWLLCILSEQRSNAENRHCVNRQTVSLQMDDFYHRDETIIPQVLEEPSHLKLQPKRCRWEISLRSARPDLQVVLEGLQSGDRGSDSAAKDDAKTFFVSAQPGSRTPVSAGMFEVRAMKHFQHFSIESNWNPGAQGPVFENLRILIPLPGLCSRDMLSFRGNCYAVSKVPESATEAMSSVRGDAQLPSFTSMAEISDFIAANSAWLKKFPYSRPLNLSQPVRLGMFLRAADDAVLSVVRRDRECGLLPASNFRDTGGVTGGVTGPCASLRVAEPDKAVVEFGDCSRPMLSLLSFPETAGSVPSSAHCNGSELALRVAQLRCRPGGTSSSPVAIVVTTDPESIETRGISSQAVIVISTSVGAAIILLIAAAAGVAVARRRRIRQLNQPTPDLQSAAIYLTVQKRAVSVIADNEGPADPPAVEEEEKSDETKGRAEDRKQLRKPLLDGPRPNQELKFDEADFVMNV